MEAGADRAYSTKPRRTRWRVLFIGIALVSTVAGYAVLMSVNGYVWPVPQVLPARFGFHDNAYTRQSTCRSLTFFNSGTLRGRSVRQVGTLPSALGFGSTPIYSWPLNLRFSTTYDQVLVRDGGCYRLYYGDKVL